MNSLFLYLKLKWKYVLYLFLICALFITIFINSYIRGYLEEALFQAFVVIFGLLFLIPFVFKIVYFCHIVRSNAKLMNDNNFQHYLIEGVASRHNKENATPIELIVDNVIAILKYFNFDNKINSLEIKDDFAKYVINNKEYSLDDTVNDQKDILMGRMEIELIYREEMDLREIEKIVIEKYNNEWENEHSKVNKEGEGQ